MLDTVLDSSLARRERHALCDLAMKVGPEAPTLCEGWASADLVAHLYVREHKPLAALGLVVPQLSGRTDAAMRAVLSDGYAALTAKLRDPGRLTPFALPPVERAANSLEYVVHHEDLRRGTDGWEPRPDDTWRPADLDLLWGQVALVGKGAVKSSGVPVQVVRSDTGAAHTLRAGDDPVVVTGPVVEIALMLSGRDAVRDVEVTGPADQVARWEGSDRSF